MPSNPISSKTLFSLSSVEPLTHKPSRVFSTFIKIHSSVGLGLLISQHLKGRGRQILGVWDQPGLNSKFQASLSYIVETLCKGERNICICSLLRLGYFVTYEFITQLLKQNYAWKLSPIDTVKKWTLITCK